MNKKLLSLSLLATLPLSASFDIGAEWLYWKAEQSQLEMASQFAITPVSGGNFIESDAIRPDFRYSSGYRIYADYQCNSPWIFGAAITHLSSNPTDSVALDPANLSTNAITINNSLYPVFMAFADMENALSSFDIKWALNLYYFDLYLRRSFFLCDCIDIEPYAGIRGFWMKQHVDVSGAAPTSPGGAVTLVGSFHEKFQGVGLHGGLNAGCQLGWGFALIGQIGGSIIYSSVHNSFDIFGAKVGSSSLEIFNDDQVHKSHPTVDSFIGLEYMHAFSFCNLELYAGWENHIFFHTNQFSLPTDGNLTTQGLTLGGSIGF